MDDRQDDDKRQSGQSNSVVMPTHRDLEASDRYKVPIYSGSPWAVYVKKVSAKERKTQLEPQQISALHEEIKRLTSKHKKIMLLDVQTREDLTFTNQELDIIRQAQDIPEFKLVVMPELNHAQSVIAFERQLDDWRAHFQNKEVVPVLEPYAESFADKAAIVKRKGLSKIGIKFSSYKKYSVEFHKALAITKALKLFRFVFGINPTKWKESNATMLLPALHAEAEAVARWVAWGGRKVPASLLSMQPGVEWTYVLAAQAGQGLVNYSGNSRTSFLSGNSQKNSAFEKIDTINQVTELIRTGALRKVSLKRLFH